MKNCVFSEIRLVSFLEKKAKSVAFDPATTTIVGENDTGKSALLKSIYWAFGAEPAATHPKWEAANVAVMLKFSVAETKYTIVRQSEYVSLFDSEDRLLWSHSSVTNGAGPELATIFDFGMVQADRQGRKVVPPPAYFFLPFYVDQDRGWNDNWASFSRLQQLPRHREFMAEYHSGLRPNRYYELNSEMSVARQELLKQKTELEAVRAARSSFDEHLPFQSFNLNPGDFASDIEVLLEQCEELAREEDRFRSAMQDLHQRLAAVDAQISLVRREAGELKKDYEFAVAAARADSIECPTCGTLHENSFLERFAIARDEDRCRELHANLIEDRQNLAAAMARTRSDFRLVSEARQKVEEALSAKRGELSLRTLIAGAGRAEVQRIFASSIQRRVAVAREVETRIEELEGALRRLEDKKRRASILTYYRSRMREYLDQLDVQNLSPASYKSIAAQIKEIGSDKPRALLAYYYSFLHTVREYGSAVFCPIVIDEPNQQGLDPKSLPSVLQFIFDRRPSSSQIILGVEDLHGVRAPGTVVRLDEKWSLLSREGFANAADEVRSFLQKGFQLEAQR